MLFPLVKAVATSPIPNSPAFLQSTAKSSSVIAESLSIVRSYPVIKHSGSKRISAPFRFASDIYLIIVLIFSPYSRLTERICKTATLKVISITPNTFYFTTNPRLWQHQVAHSYYGNHIAVTNKSFARRVI